MSVLPARIGRGGTAPSGVSTDNHANNSSALTPTNYAPDQLLTADGGPIKVDQETRQKIAIFGDGRVLISASHADTPGVQSALKVAELDRRVARLLPPEYVDPEEIEAAYRASAGGAFRNQVQLERIIEQSLAEAHECGASDIWIRPTGSAAEVLWRVHGSMTPVVEVQLKAENDAFNRALFEACDKRSPGSYDENRGQLGRLSPEQTRIKLPEGIASVRMTWSVAGTGRDTSIRILETEASQAVRSLDELDLLPSQKAALDLMLDDSGGLVITGGPTGSGKSTLVKILLELYLERRQWTKKAVSVEDPPEFQIRGISQLQVSTSYDPEQKRADYEQAHEQFVRLDPDVGMLGEIRNEVTCDAAFKIAESGHWGISTTHAPNGAAIPRRLRAWGAPEWLLFEPHVMRGLIYQRLVPVLCPDCCMPLLQAIEDQSLPPTLRADYAKVAQLLVEAAKRYELSDIDLEAVRVRGVDACKTCAPPPALLRRLERVAKRRSSAVAWTGTRGVKGRKAVAEVIRPDRHLLRLIQAGTDASEDPTLYWMKELGGEPIERHLLARIANHQLDPLDAHRTHSLAPEASELRRTIAAARRTTQAARPSRLRPP